MLISTYSISIHNKKLNADFTTSTIFTNLQAFATSTKLLHNIARYYTEGRIIKANLSWNRTRVKFCQLTASLCVILLQLNWQNSNLTLLNLAFSVKKKDRAQLNLQLTGKICSSSTSAQVYFYNTTLNFFSFIYRYNTVL